MPNITEQERFKFASNLVKKLRDTPNELYLRTYKDALNTITDREERLKVEGIVEIFLNVNMPSNIVVLIHGIRTYAEWQELLKSQLDDYSDIKTYPIGYGYFDAFCFWLPWIFRGVPIDRVAQKLRNIQAKHPADNIIVIAHSYGTYAISKILSDNPDIKIRRLLFCGSIIESSFRWDKLANIPCRIINDCGSKDIWPVLAKSLSWGYGSSGRFGFKTSEIEDRYHDLGHSDFFELEFMKKFWIPFILSGENISSDWNSKLPKPSFGVVFFDIVPTKSILFVGSVLIAVYWNDLVTTWKNLF